MQKKCNRESTIIRKIKYFTNLSGSPEEMVTQVLNGSWRDKVKSNALDAIWQYAEFIGKPIEKVKFRVFDNTEAYVPNPDMVKVFLYRVTLNVRTRMLIAIETGACAGEVWRLTWNEFNPQNKSLTIIGVKGHRTLTYHVSDELCTLLMQIPRKAQRIFDNVVFAGHLNGRLNYYARGTQVLVQQMSGGTSGAEICLCITGKK